MYKIILIIGLVFFFIGCDDKNSGVIADENRTFHPFKIADISYNDKNSITFLGMSKNIYIAGKDDGSVDIGEVKSDGSHRSLQNIQEVNASRLSCIATDEEYFVMSEYTPDDVYFYKIEDNLSVHKLAKIHVEDTSSKTVTRNNSLAFKDKTIAISELRSYYDSVSNESWLDDKVVIYTIKSDESLSRVQEIRSDREDANDTNNGRNFAASIALSQDYLTVTESCMLHLYTKNQDGIFIQSDATMFNEKSPDDSCFLNVTMDNNHIIAHSRRLRMNLLFQIKDGKFVKSQEILNENSARDFGSVSAFVEDKLLINSDDKLLVYTLKDENDSIVINKFLDINETSMYFAASQEYFITADFYKDSFSLYALYPENKIYTYSDINATLMIDEEEIYDFYTLDANSLASDLMFTLNGVDASNFKIDNTSLMNLAAFDYENPVDSDMDNTYSVSIEVTDAQNNRLTLPFNVKVLNRDYLFKDQIASEVKVDNMNLGKSLSLDGTNLLVGAKASVYLFDTNKSLKELKKIIPNVNDADDSFGESVAISGNNIVVGAPSTDINGTAQGVVYLFKVDENRTVTQETKIESPSLEDFGVFGSVVANDENITLISAPGYGYGFNGVGKVYIYTNEINGSFTLLQTLSNLDGKYSRIYNFGASLALTKEYLLVGSPGKSYENKASVGAAYLYKRETNTTLRLVDTLVPNSAIGSQDFSYSLSMSGNYIVIGTLKEEVYIFKIDITGTHANKIATLHESNSGFGRVVSIKDKDIFVLNNSTQEGVIYHYKIEQDDSVTLVETIINHNKLIDVKEFEASVQGKDMFIVGTPSADINATNSGAITMFTKE